MSIAQLFNDEPGDKGARTVSIHATLILANVLAWAWALWSLADRPALLATAFLAYAFGLRHAVDADHIAAVDNVVRKLMQEGKRPLSAGFFFSLEWPSEKKKPADSGRLPSCMSLRTTLSIAAMWSASTACRSPNA